MVTRDLDTIVSTDLPIWDKEKARIARRQAGVTQAEIARELQVPSPVVSYVEGGKYPHGKVGVTPGTQAEMVIDWYEQHGYAPEVGGEEAEEQRVQWNPLQAEVARVEAGYNLAELATELEVSPSTVGKIEGGKYPQGRKGVVAGSKADRVMEWYEQNGYTPQIIIEEETKEETEPTPLWDPAQATAARNAADYTITRLAQEQGVSTNTVRSVESGKYPHGKAEVRPSVSAYKVLNWYEANGYTPGTQVAVIKPWDRARAKAIREAAEHTTTTLAAELQTQEYRIRRAEKREYPLGSAGVRKGTVERRILEWYEQRMDSAPVEEK